MSVFHAEGQDAFLTGIFAGVAAAVPFLPRKKQRREKGEKDGRTYIIQHQDGFIQVMRVDLKAGEAERRWCSTAREAMVEE